METPRILIGHVRDETRYRKDGLRTVYVGRRHGSALGNPFFLRHEADRARVIEQYRHWLWRKLKSHDRDVVAALDHITSGTRLLCHCHPLPCHADVIAKAWAWLQHARAHHLYPQEASDIDD